MQQRVQSHTRPEGGHVTLSGRHSALSTQRGGELTGPIYTRVRCRDGC
jgi:hypothetical protein